MIHNAYRKLKLGERAIALFTRGDRFVRDPAGDGSTGNWTTGEKSLKGMEKVIIYHRDDHTGRNTVYMGKYRGWSPSEEEGRKIIYFSKLIRAGETASLWPEFKGSSGSMPFAYLH